MHNASMWPRMHNASMWPRMHNASMWPRMQYLVFYIQKSNFLPLNKLFVPKLTKKVLPCRCCALVVDF
jgi:hypothetical protein